MNSRPTKPAEAVFEHPRMGSVFGFGGIVGIAIAMMDHKYTLLGFLMCWGSATALIVLYYPQWRLMVHNHFTDKVYKKKIRGRDHLFSPIFILMYFIAPIAIYIHSPLSTDYILQWGMGDRISSFAPGNPFSYRGPKASIMTADGKLVRDNIGDSYSLMGACYHHSHPFDAQDEPNISKSGLYDVGEYPIQMVIPWSNEFFLEVINGLRGTEYELLALPKSLTPDKFKTVREAVSLGAIRLQYKGGPP